MNKTLLALFTASAMLVSWQTAVAADGPELFKSKGCSGCHSIDSKLVGPAYKDVAKKFAGQDGAAEELAGRIKNGSKGVWGPIPIPPNAVTEDEAKILAQWVLTL